MNRALPGRIRDLICDGVPPSALVKGRADRAVYNSVLSTAMSANVHGQHQIDWEDQLLAADSRLGQQMRRHGNGKVRSGEQVMQYLDKVWTKADALLEEAGPALTRDLMREQGNERARALLAAVEDPAANLSNSERAVLAHAAEAVLRYNEQGKAVDRVTLPRAQMLPHDVAGQRIEATGLGLTALRTALRRLADRNLLVLAERGEVRSKRRPKPRANVYALPEPGTLRRAVYPLDVPEDGSVVPLAQISGAPVPAAPGAPAQISGAPTCTTDKEGPSMAVTLTVTVTAPDAEELAAALALLRRESSVQVQTTATTTDAPLPANVTALPRRGRRAS